MTDDQVYHKLAHLLDSLPNGFPACDDGTEIRLLKKLFSPDEAEVALLLTQDLQTVPDLAAQSGGDPKKIREHLKSMTRAGLINSGRTSSGLGFGLLPFVVGFFENQVASIDKELAELVEDYFSRVFDKALLVQPQFHRVIPVGESIRSGIEIHPYESAAEILTSARAWGVLDCICRKQKNLIGQGCSHPVDICMAMADVPGAFDSNPVIRSLTLDEALETLNRASRAGLVHSVSNNVQGTQYICNCCTCSCGILRGVASTGMANVVARSAFINTVEPTLCNACEACIAWCQFGALSMQDCVQIDSVHCVGCGVCVQACPSNALTLVRRPESDILPIPETPGEWEQERRLARGMSS
jgi:ferredoxin